MIAVVIVIAGKNYNDTAYGGSPGGSILDPQIGAPVSAWSCYTDLVQSDSKLEQLKNRHDDLSGQADHVTRNLELLVEIKQLQKEAKKEKEKAIGDIINYFDNFTKECDKYWNKLGGKDAIDSFEKKWTGWTIDETLQWFNFVLKNNTFNSDNDSDYEIEYYSSSSSDDDDEDEDDEKKVGKMSGNGSGGSSGGRGSSGSSGSSGGSGSRGSSGSGGSSSTRVVF